MTGIMGAFYLADIYVYIKGQEKTSMWNKYLFFHYSPTEGCIYSCIILSYLPCLHCCIKLLLLKNDLTLVQLDIAIIKNFYV